MPTRTALSILLVVSAVLIVAAIPPAAPIFSQEFQLSPTTASSGDRYVPAIAYNSTHHEYLVVWHNKWSSGHRDVYARRVTTAGEIKSWFAVSVGANDRFRPAVAYNPVNDNYLVVWMYDPGNTHYEIWGRIVAWDGSSMGAPFQILVWPSRAFWYPRVVWNSYRHEYLMVANGHDTVGAWNDITARRVSATGTVPGGVLVYQDPARQPNYPSLVYNLATDEYLVAWRHLWTPGDWDIHGAIVSGNGSTVTHSNIVLDQVTFDQDTPVVATNSQGRYLVVWQQYMYTDWDIYGREFDVNGNAVSNQYAIAFSSADEKYPTVVGMFGPADKTDYVAAWQRTAATGTEIWASRWGMAVPGYSAPPFQVAGAAFWNNEAPAVGLAGSSYLFAYEGDSSITDRHIYGTVWSPNGLFLPLTRR